MKRKKLTKYEEGFTDAVLLSEEAFQTVEQEHIRYRKALVEISGKVKSIEENFVHLSLIDVQRVLELGEIADKALE